MIKESRATTSPLPQFYEFECPNCGSSLKSKTSAIGQLITCHYCDQQITIPAPKTYDKHLEKKPKSEDLLFGLAGLICEIILFVGIAMKPDSFKVFALLGALGIAGLVFAIIGIVAKRGRTVGIIAIVLFLLAWVVNTVITGRL